MVLLCRENRCHCEEGQCPDVAIPLRFLKIWEIATPVCALARNDTIYLVIARFNYELLVLQAGNAGQIVGIRVMKPVLTRKGQY